MLKDVCAMLTQENRGSNSLRSRAAPQAYMLAVCLAMTAAPVPDAQALSGSLRGYRFTQVAKLGDAVPGRRELRDRLRSHRAQ